MTPAPTSDPQRPAHLLAPEVLNRLRHLELVARGVVEGLLGGLHRSPMFGFSQEFAEYRAYAEGDDPRFIDWNVYARTDRTYVKRFLGDTNSHLMLLVDASASMGFASGSVSKLRYAKLLAASLAWLAARQHDAVGTIVFDEDVRSYRPPSTRHGHLQTVLHTLDAAEPATGTEFVRPFEKFREHIRRRGLVAVLSDFYCDADELLRGVRPLAWQGQDVILLQILDPQELAPSIESNTALRDPETGHSVEVSPEFLRDVYPDRMRAHIERLGRAAAGAGADHLVVRTDAPLDRTLRRYLGFRERRR